VFRQFKAKIGAIENDDNPTPGSKLEFFVNENDRRSFNACDKLANELAGNFSTVAKRLTTTSKRELPPELIKKNKQDLLKEIERNPNDYSSYLSLSQLITSKERVTLPGSKEMTDQDLRLKAVGLALDELVKEFLSKGRGPAKMKVLLKLQNSMRNTNTMATAALHELQQAARGIELEQAQGEEVRLRAEEEVRFYFVTCLLRGFYLNERSLQIAKYTAMAEATKKQAVAFEQQVQATLTAQRTEFERKMKESKEMMDKLNQDMLDTQKMQDAETIASMKSQLGMFSYFL